jgi:hypothetical protein
MAFENNVQATLQSNVAIGATTVDVVKAVAPNKDVPVSGRLTLSATGKTEIISYTGRTDNTTYWTLTGVTKNAESSFRDHAGAAGDACFQALTAADVASLSTIHSATAPTNPTVGTKWFNTTTGVLQEYLTDGTDFAWLDISAGATVGAPAGLSATVIAPAAQGYINSENSGTAAGCSYTYNAGTTTVTFNTAMADINYSVITDKEGFDEHQVLTGNKSLTSFSMLSRDSAGTNVMSPTSWPYSFVVYASDPVQNVLANKGDTGATGPAGSSTLSGLSDSPVATTDPLTTSNPSAIGHLWINSTTANAYICTNITTGSNVWINIGSGTGNVDPDSFSGGTYTAVGGYKYRTFTSSGALQQTGSSTVDMLVVAGGGSGAGANNSNGGGGGAGGYLSGSLTLTAGTYNIVIGAGGAGAVQLAGNNGGTTTVSNINAIAIGGGHGGGGARNSQVPASNGGSGGGGSGFSQDTAGGSGTQAASGGLTGFGNDGGSASGNIADGGGGAGGAGTTSGSVGHGGLGRQWVDINYYAGGGGGGGNAHSLGGSAVGGRGGYDDLFDLDAIVNTGSGGGGSWSSATTGYAGGNGSAGIVIIRYT